MSATSIKAPPINGVGQPLDRLLRPAAGFRHPYDVVKDPLLAEAEKRAILASWASDASAVEDQPHLRWLFGTVEPVPLDDILESLARLDGPREPNAAPICKGPHLARSTGLHPSKSVAHRLTECRVGTVQATLDCANRASGGRNNFLL